MSTLCLKSTICVNMICEKQILELRREGKLESRKLKVKAEENIDQTKVKIEKNFKRCFGESIGKLNYDGKR